MGEKILIVEDDQTYLEVMKFKLEQEGYRIERAADVSEALSIIERNKIDLIISDILMPNVSGLNFLSIIREFYFGRVPVIIVSSLNKYSVIALAIGLGACDFMVKPVNFERLCFKISLLLHTKT